MVRAFISIGSNIHPAENVRAALLAMAACLKIVRISTVYRTQAEERPEQPDFYNCVVEVETDIPPFDLKWRILRPIEAAQERQRTSDRYAPRTMDLDLIIYGDLVVKTDDLVLPDPEITSRSFLALPLAELEPGLVIPGGGACISDVAAAFHNNTMQTLEDYTESLRNQLSRPR